jgi:hypothetical protein
MHFGNQKEQTLYTFSLDLHLICSKYKKETIIAGEIQKKIVEILMADVCQIKL